MFNPMYRRGTWVAVILMVFHELAGSNAILLYSNIIIKKMNKDDPNAISPRVGTYLVGIVNFLSSLCALYLIKKLKRRTLLVPGHVLMGTCHVLIGVFAILNKDTGTLVMLLSFLAAY